MKRVQLLWFPILTLIVSLSLFSCGDGGGGGSAAKLLDALFGTGGKVTTPIGNIDDTSYALAIQSDGKIVAAGYTDTGSQFEFALVRYNTDGSLDTSFGAGGILTTDINGIDDEAFALIIQPSDEKLVVAGYSDNGSQRVFALARYDTDGTLDASFGTGGIVTTAIGIDDDKINALVIQPSDGKLVAAGFSYDGSQNVFALVRYNTDGSLDTTGFGTGGIVTTAVGDYDAANALAIQPSDGKLVAAGYSYDGGLDEYKFALARYNTDGSLDTTGFGTGGIVTTAIGTIDDTVFSLAIQPSDGKLVAAGYTNYGDITNGPWKFVLVRYNTDGSLDTTGFGTGGIVTTAIGTIDDEAFALAIQSDDKLVAAGYSNNGTQFKFALARYNTDGSLDTTFNKTGKIITDVGGDDAATSLAIQSDDKLVASGYSYNNSLGQYEFALVRYLP